MADFIYKEPKLCKDKENKKWFIRYSIKYEGDEKLETRKEYGRTITGKSLNLIPNLKEREKEFKDVLKTLKAYLADGIDIQRPEIVKAKIEEQIQDAKKKSFEVLFAFYCKDKGYDKPVQKKELSAANIKAFFNNQFKPFLEKKGFDKDLSKVTKKDIAEFMNAQKWGHTTFNNRRGWLHGFFKTLIDEDLLEIENPTDKIRVKEGRPTERFEVFSKEERDVLFDYFDKNDLFVATVIRVFYYAYIRGSELSRMKVKDFLMDKNQILIMPENAKKQVDNLPRWVFITDKLKVVLEKYLATFEHNPDDYMFGKKEKPSKYRLINNWQRKFRTGLKACKKSHPHLFQTDNQSPYSFKHTGVTMFVNDNINNKTAVSILRYVQAQCRHSNLATTEKYLKKLTINLQVAEEFIYD